MIASIAIPISIIATFNLMYFNGLSLNIMTLGGLALGAGMLVDNAIVVMENIFRHMQRGMSVKEAAITGTAEVGGAITASTLTTIVVFLPIVYLHGAASELFKDQAWTVAFSLLSSLFVALLVIPMLFSRFIKPGKKKIQDSSVKFAWYAKFLSGILRYKYIVILIAGLLVAFGFYLFPKVGSEFMPRTEGREFSMDIKLDEGTRINRTEKAILTLESMMRETIGDELKTLYCRIGPASSSSDANSIFENENTANIKVVLKQDGEVSTTKIMDALGRMVENMPDMEVMFIQDETALQTTLGTDDAPIIVEIVGKEFEHIERITAQVEEIMLNNPNLYNVETSFEDGAPEVEVIVDRYRAGIYNLSVDQIVSQIQDILEGAEAGDFEHEGELKTIRIKLPEVQAGELSNIILKTGTTELRLADVASINIVDAPKEILRSNQNRVGKVSSQFHPDKPFDHIILELDQQLADISLPPRYNIRQAGEEQKRRESMDNLRFALILSLVLVYMVLASQFESLLHPFTIILTVPLALVGSVVLFFILGKSLNIMAIIGIIMLIGIAVNDSIILVDFINQLKKSGVKRIDAIMQAGQHRIRPIIMTSLTTVLALLPLTIGFGESAALRAPMALAVIGGLVTSTLLTLIVIPCVYAVFDQFIDWIKPAKQTEQI